jgi:hypothetical protein
MIYIRKQQVLEKNGRTACYTESFICTVSYCLSQVDHVLIKQVNCWCIKVATMIRHYTHTKMKIIHIILTYRFVIILRRIHFERIEDGL